MKIEQYIVGMVGTNCYVLWNEETKEGLIVDPGDNGAHIEQQMKKIGVTPIAILLTHGHFDHIMGVSYLKDTYQIPVYAQKDEQETLNSPQYNLSGMGGITIQMEADVYSSDGDVLSLAGFEIQVLHTPGHTVGGCCYYFPKEKVLMSGDTLFAQSVGRTDFPKGSISVLTRSIKEKLFILPGDVKVYPGHEGTTTIGYEKVNNPFL